MLGSGQWTRSVSPRCTETCSFMTVSDDTAKVWVGSKLVIDSGMSHGPRVDKGSIALRAGHKYDIEV